MRWTTAASPRVLVTHGLSGCGKSTLAPRLVERARAVRVRSDVERRRAIEPLRDDERARYLYADTSSPIDEEALARRWLAS